MEFSQELTQESIQESTLTCRHSGSQEQKEHEGGPDVAFRKHRIRFLQQLSIHQYPTTSWGTSQIPQWLKAYSHTHTHTIVYKRTGRDKRASELFINSHPKVQKLLIFDSLTYPRHLSGVPVVAFSCVYSLLCGKRQTPLDEQVPFSTRVIAKSAPSLRARAAGGQRGNSGTRTDRRRPQHRSALHSRFCI